MDTSITLSTSSFNFGTSVSVNPLQGIHIGLLRAPTILLDAIYFD